MRTRSNASLLSWRDDADNDQKEKSSGDPASIVVVSTSGRRISTTNQVQQLLSVRHPSATFLLGLYTDTMGDTGCNDNCQEESWNWQCSSMGDAAKMAQ